MPGEGGCYVDPGLELHEFHFGKREMHKNLLLVQENCFMKSGLNNKDIKVRGR